MNIWQVSIPGYPHTQAFDTVALCLRESIRELGFKSEIVRTPTPNTIVLGAHLVPGALPSDCIIYNLEQLSSSSSLVNSNYLANLRMNRVWDYSSLNISKLNELDIAAVHMPIGYHPVLTRMRPAKKLDIDCFFYGSMNDRRTAICHSVGAISIFNIYGQPLDNFIARSKIVLNMHHYDSNLFEIVRCSYLLANKKFIISEFGDDLNLEAPLVDGIAFHKAEGFPHAVRYYLSHPEIMVDFAEHGFKTFSNMKQTEYLENESKSWQR